MKQGRLVSGLCSKAPCSLPLSTGQKSGTWDPSQLSPMSKNRSHDLFLKQLILWFRKTKQSNRESIKRAANLTHSPLCDPKVVREGKFKRPSCVNHKENETKNERESSESSRAVDMSSRFPRQIQSNLKFRELAGGEGCCLYFTKYRH